MRFVILSLVFGLLLSSAPPAEQSAASVEVVGAMKQPLRLNAEDLSKMPRASVDTRFDGVAVHYEGVWLTEVLKKAGVPSGVELRGKWLTGYLLMEAEDGYQVIFTLADLDPMFGGNPVLLADAANGKALSGAEGPFRLVAPRDRRGARSVRMLKKIEIVLLRK
ncbi:MAG: molybdopterin-dependent oxidoreductase [Bryobacterales bacterium]|nr:molybdopterin-dependent oxidoreductase [Bryobacterales bacterium]